MRSVPASAVGAGFKQKRAVVVRVAFGKWFLKHGAEVEAAKLRIFSSASTALSMSAASVSCGSNRKKKCFGLNVSRNLGFEW
jgi:hypothetical protein